MISITSSIRKLRSFISQFRLKYLYWVIEEPSGRKGFAVIGDPSGRHPFRELYLDTDTQTQSVIYWGGFSVAGRLAAKYGLAVASGKELPASLVKQTVRMPNFAALELQLPPTLEQYQASLGHSARDDIRRIRNAGYTYQISQDSSWCAEFLHRYHSPAINRRHGVAGYIMPLEEITNLVAKKGGHFLKVYSNKTCVGGMIFQVVSDCFHILRVGWLDGDEGLYRKGVVAALYWFCIQQAFRLQCRVINFGGTPSYLENGVLKFKAKWGATLSNKYTKLSSRFLLMNPENPQCRVFLQNYSLILLEEDLTFSVLSSQYPQKSVVADCVLKNIKRWYVLRTEKMENKEGVVDNRLPKQLAVWYRRIPDEQLGRLLKFEQLENVDTPGRIN
jgi:hypothetical protein